MVQDLDPAETRGWVGQYENTRPRTCIVAGIFEDDKRVYLEGERQPRKGQKESKAFRNEGPRYAWDLEGPGLFTKGVKYWIDCEEMPKDFLAIDG